MAYKQFYFAVAMFAGLCVAPEPSYAVTTEAQAAYDLGSKAMADKKYEDAIDAFSDAIALAPDWAEAYYQRAWVYIELKKPKRAVPDLTQVVRINPTWAPGWVERGYAYNVLKEHQKALADLNRALALVPNDDGALAERCYAYVHIEPMSALADCNASLSIKPGNGRALTYRGDAYGKLSRWREAIADYEAALNTQPDRKDPKKYNRVKQALAEARIKLKSAPAEIAAPSPPAAPSAVPAKPAVSRTWLRADLWNGAGWYLAEYVGRLVSGPFAEEECNAALAAAAEKDKYDYYECDYHSERPGR